MPTTISCLIFLPKSCLEWQLSTKVPPFPRDRIKTVTVRDLVLESIQRFRPAALRSPASMLASIGETRPVEAVYRDELSRACHSLLGDFYLTPEWSGREKTGRIDLFVPEMGWGIECARDGVKLLGHIKRFLEGGNYYPWITSGQMTDYILIDFRQTLPRTPQRMLLPFLYSTVF